MPQETANTSAAAIVRGASLAALLAYSLAHATVSFAEIAFQSTPDTNAVVGEHYSYHLVAKDTGDGGGAGHDDKPKLVFEAPVLPGWLELRGDKLDGTPALLNLGPNPVVLTATAKDDSTATQAFTIDVGAPLNAKPTVNREISPDPQTATEGQPYGPFNVSPFFSDPDGATLTFSAAGLPSGLAIDSGGVISGQPAAGTAGSHTVTVMASDGTDAATDSFTLNVVAANQPPTLTGPIGAQSTTEGADFSFDVSRYFDDPDGDKLSFQQSGLPSGLSMDGGGKISGRAGDGTAGSHTIGITASDPGGQTATGSFTLTISAANRRPVLSSPLDAQSTTEGAAFNVDVSSHFSDPDGDKLSFRQTGLPSGLSMNGDGTITGRAGDGTAQSSPYTITVTATDPSGLDANGTFALTVTAANKPPEQKSAITPDPQSATEGADYRFNVSGFFRDPDGDTLSYSASGLPGGLSIDASSGVISGKPAAGSAGASPYSVQVTASDGSGAASGRFTLNVAAQNQPPSLPDPPPRLSTPEDTALTITATMLHAVDEDPASLTVVLTAPASGSHFSVSGATVRPEANFNGTVQVQARVKDATATSNAVTVSIDVTAVNDAPAIQAISDQSAAEGAPFTLDLGPFVSDAEQDALTFSATQLPPGLTLDAATGRLSGTPPVGSAGDYQVALTVSDGAASGSAHFLLKVAKAGEADIAAAAGVTPNPVLVGQSAKWTIGVTNAGALDVASVNLDAVFSSDVPLRFDPVDPACTLQPQGSQTHVTCRLGPVAGGASASIDVSVSSTQAGHAAVVVTVGIADAVPIDGNATNDTARASLDVTQSLSTSAAQHLDAPGASAVASGDFNGDGHDDLAAATPSGPLVFLNGTSPTDSHKLAFPNLPLAYSEPSGATGVAAADLDGDGDLDLAVASATAPNGVLLNDGSGAFTAKPLTDHAAASHAVAAADVNGDGLVDLIFANDGANEVYLNDGTGGFTRAALPGAAQPSVDVVVADLVGDPLPELVFANADGDATAYVSSAGGYTPVALQTGATTSVAAADFDGDGIADLVFGRADGVDRVYLNTSTAALSLFPGAELDGVATSDVLAGDFDLDGSSDVLTIDSAGAHALYTNAGGASTQFLLHPEQFSTTGALGAVAGKFNADDRADVAIAGGDALAVFLNDGHGNLGLGDTDAPVITLKGEPSINLTVGDQYVDAGATASDAIDGDLTSKITVSNPVDTNVIGTYTVTYDVVDSAGNAATTSQRSVNVQAHDAGGGGGGGSIGMELGLLALIPLLARLRRARHSFGAQQ
jgi:hypothetical protein